MNDLARIHELIYQVNWRSAAPPGNPGLFRQTALELVRSAGAIKKKLSGPERYNLAGESELLTLLNHPDEVMRAALAIAFGTLYSVDVSRSGCCIGFDERSAFLWDYLSDPSARVRIGSLHALDDITGHNMCQLRLGDERISKVLGHIEDDCPHVSFLAAGLFARIYSQYPSDMALPDSFVPETLNNAALNALGLPKGTDKLSDTRHVFTLALLLADPRHHSLIEDFPRGQETLYPYRGISGIVKAAVLARLIEYAIDPDPETNRHALQLIDILSGAAARGQDAGKRARGNAVRRRDSGSRQKKGTA